MFSKALLTQAKALLRKCEKAGYMIATAESCTGGLVAALLTEIPGSSKVFDRGFITYCNDSKHKLLGVPKKTLKAHGAVSAEVAKAMAESLLRHSESDLGISVTGIAGPTGATETKPVGRVYIAVATRKKKTCVKEFTFPGNRQKVRMASVAAALALASDCV